MGHQTAADIRRTSQLANRMGFLLLLVVAYLSGQFGLGPWLANARPTVNNAALTSKSSSDKLHTTTAPTEKPASSDKDGAEVQIRVVDEIRPQKHDAPTTLSSDALGSLNQLATQSQNSETSTDTTGDPVALPVYTVRAGTFMNKATAEDLSRKLTERGVPSQVMTESRDGHSAYVVDLRTFDDKSAADAYVQSLRSIYSDVWIVTRTPDTTTDDGSSDNAAE